MLVRTTNTNHRSIGSSLAIQESLKRHVDRLRDGEAMLIERAAQEAYREHEAEEGGSARAAQLFAARACGRCRDRGRHGAMKRSSER
jgi:hypothetical protein